MSEVMMDRELGWDDQISKESEFTLLPEGDYDFEVISYERGRHNGSEKLPPCNKAVVTLRVDSEDGSATLKYNLFLHTKTEGMLSAFFAGIGLKKKGEPLTMNWNAIPGCTGRAKIGIRKYTGNDGVAYQNNEIRRIYPKEEKAFTPGSF